MAVSANPIVYPFFANHGEPERCFVCRCGRYGKTKYNPSGCHMGWDFGVASGTRIAAIVSGEVVRVSTDEYLGKYTVTRNRMGDFYQCHMRDKPKVVKGQKVVRGKTLMGLVGQSGNANGNHLHVTWTQGPSVGKAWGSVPFGDVYPFVYYSWKAKYGT